MTKKYLEDNAIRRRVEDGFLEDWIGQPVKETSRVKFLSAELTEYLKFYATSEPDTPNPGEAVLYLIDDGDGTHSLWIKFDNGVKVAIAGN